MKVLKGSDPEAIREAAEVIREGGIVAFPTETVYGLGANAFDPMAVARVFEVKGRPRFDPLICHIGRRDQVEGLWREVPERAKGLMERFWPGPLTLVYHKRPEVPDIVTAGLETVAVRMPAHPVALSLLREAGVPIAAPSANTFGRLSPTRAEHVLEDLGEKVDLILDGGPCPVGVESTIISLVHDPPRLLRPGGIPVEEIEGVVGPVERQGGSRRPEAPGGLKSHYRPRTPLILLGEGEIPKGLRVGLLAFKEPKEGPFSAVEVLSPRGDLREAASRLFEALHRLDRLGLDLIVAEPVPEEGLGLAIMDRLRRARWRVS